jgi:hypothetical protein
MSGDAVSLARAEPRICVLREWKPSTNPGSLAGKATVAFSGGWIVSNIPIFRRSDGALSPGAPDMPLVGPDGAQLVGEDGKRRYAKVISFETSAARTRWNDAIVHALNEAGVR